MTKLLLATLAALTLLGVPAFSQSTAQMSGTIRDAAGLAVPSAEVKATQTATGLVRTASSDGDGAYILTNLPIGPYMLEVSKDGFTKYVQSGIVLQVINQFVSAYGTQVQVDTGQRIGRRRCRRAGGATARRTRP